MPLNTEEKNILTNVAWIAEDYNVQGNEITDRDSNPGTTPNVNKDNMENYTGKDNKEDLSDSENYYKGQQDDDDFEKLVITGLSFDLALRKYISNIERNGETVEFSSRVPEVDTTPLHSNSTTADYIHPKDTLIVKQGDIITYKLRIYNEGELDGYATEITDFIPKGLEFKAEDNKMQMTWSPFALASSKTEINFWGEGWEVLGNSSLFINNSKKSFFFRSTPSA